MYITTNVVSSNSVHGEVYSIQPYVIKFVSDNIVESGVKDHNSTPLGIGHLLTNGPSTTTI